jgi:ubiquinone/menaquinone biosynthesis C-methylase UbiE
MGGSIEHRFRGFSTVVATVSTSRNPSEIPGPGQIDREIVLHYSSGLEEQRLAAKARGRLEFLRTMEILARYLPPPPARILDVGGGPGRYALALGEAGYEVELIDAVELHIQQARSSGVEHASVGDARQLELPDGSFDAVLLLGPLYHLTARAERIVAWSEAARVVRRGGMVAGAAISRFASLLDSLNLGFLAEPGFEALVDEDLRSGQHRNPERRERWFTTAYLHHPDELLPEMIEAGLDPLQVVAVEGPAQNMTESLSMWLDDPRRTRLLLDAIARVESEPSMLGSTGHLLAIGRSQN